MNRYDGRGYGYFSLVKPDNKPHSNDCPFCGLPARVCDCSDVTDYGEQDWEDYNSDD